MVELNETEISGNVREYDVYYFYLDISWGVIDKIIKPGMSEYEKVKAIHDWLVLNCEYDYNHYYVSYFEYGPMVYGVGVCQGYAMAFKQLAELAGLEAKVVTGKDADTGGGHAWNQVKVDGEWYNLDVTWADWGDSAPILYFWFMKSDGFFEKSHIFDEPSNCKSTKYD